MMLQKLDLISRKSREAPQMKFSALAHLINKESLLESYGMLRRGKACGVDGVSMEDYDQDLERNIENLVRELKAKTWEPLPVRKVYIPKPGKDEKRGLGIPDVEGKLVQMMVKRILEAIYEPCFRNSSYGFRVGRNAHQAVIKLDEEIMGKPVNYVVEVDIRRYFDEISHYWLLRCIEERISDPNFIWIIRKLLKAGVLEDSVFYESKVGSPQGGVASPILANIFLHYVLDIWFEIVMKPLCSGYASQIRYCDDFVACFGNREDAERYLRELNQRFSKFGLRIAEDKTKVVEFGRSSWMRKKRLDTFTFLGFTHYCTKSRKGYFKVGHKTSKGSLKKGLSKITEYVKKARNTLSVKEIWKGLTTRMTGHYNYFSISGNYHSICGYYNQVIHTAFKWINRRSQRKTMNWEQFHHYILRFPLPKPRIYHAFYKH